MKPKNRVIQSDAQKGLYRSPTARFRDWMHSRGGIYTTLQLKYYQDGEPYFAYLGAEMSLSEFLRREDELTEPEHN
jgi:hypothetical protein